MKKGIIIMLMLLVLVPHHVFAIEENNDEKSLAVPNQEQISENDVESQGNNDIDLELESNESIKINEDKTSDEKDGVMGQGRNKQSYLSLVRATSNTYGNTWSGTGQNKVMYDGTGKKFGYGTCKKVVDVSSYNGTVNWQGAKNNDIDGAILRIVSHSGGMHEDAQFSNNFNGCKSVGMPFGIYIYSYANDTSEAANEANTVVSILKKYGIRPSDMAYPVYYDLEGGVTSSGNATTAGLSLAQNEANINTFITILNNNGYAAKVYSYVSYIQNHLTSEGILKNLSWVAAYRSALKWDNSYYKGLFGWQYSSGEYASYITGNNNYIDVSCFSNYYGFDSDNHVNEPLGRDEDEPYLEYRANCENVDWLPYFMEPNTAGTTGRSSALYQLQIKMNNVLNSSHLSGTIINSKNTLVYDNIENNTIIGEYGIAMRQVKFQLDNVEGYRLEYRVHSANIGWQEWVREGNFAGDESKDIQAIDFRLVKDETKKVEYPQIYYKAHMSSTGWLEYVPNNQISGELDNSHRMEALYVGLDGEDDYTLNAKVFIDDKWLEINDVKKDTVIGTTGQSKALKGIKLDLNLYGYSLLYRVYIENVGWQDWTNDQAGDLENNIKAIQIKLICDTSYINKIFIDSNKTINIHETNQLKATVRPLNTTMNKAITWSSSDNDIVSVDENGNIQGLSIGQADIKATSINGIIGICHVKVIIPIDKIELDQTAKTININDKLNLSATVYPSDTTEDKTLAWKSSNQNVATVDQNGIVKGIHPGTVVITVTTLNGKTATCRVTVLSPITSVTLNKTEMTLEKTNTETLEATINPSDTTDNKTLIWKSSDQNVATVDQNGKVTGVNTGTASITVTTSNNKTATCQVTVIKQKPTLSYQTHVQDYGWQATVSEGEMSGTTRKSKRLEGIRININNNESYTGSIQYRTHVQDIGWQNWVSDGQMSGTTGESKRLEAIQIKLTGELANNYDVYYRVHAQEFGWLDWAKNGESSGTAGYSYRLEAIEIKLVEKEGSAPGSTARPFHQKYYVGYQTHVQDYGWQGMAYDGSTSGTTGRSKRLEGIQIKLENPLYEGNIEYKTHIQDIGWETSWTSNGSTSGTTGKSKRLEAIQIKLTGEMANQYNIYYRVHAQDYGWLGWASDGASAGTEGLSKRLEGIQIKLVKKGEAAPGSIDSSFIRK